MPESRRPWVPTLALALSACGGVVQAPGGGGPLAASTDEPRATPSAPSVPRFSVAPSAVAVPRPAPDASSVLTALGPFEVMAGSLARRRLYSWTTDAQRAELLRTGTLLTRAASPTRGLAYAHAVLDARADQGDRAAALLRAEAFQRARFGWPSAFAALLGGGDESYGQRLVRIVLKPEALFAVLRVGAAPEEDITFVDAEDRPVELAFALAHPERIAVVYFEHRARADARFGSYREYVVCNEFMIEEWSLDGESLSRELETEASALDRLAAYLDGREIAPVELSAAWRAHRDAMAPSVGVAWARAVALGSEPYALSHAAVTALVRAVRAVSVEPSPFVVRPFAPFPRSSAIPRKRTKPKALPAPPSVSPGFSTFLPVPPRGGGP